MKTIFLLLALIGVLLPVPRAYAAQVREMFVSVIERPQVLSSREAIEKLVAFSRQARVKVLYVQVYRANQAWFPSKIADSSVYAQARKSVGEDPLVLLIDKAHAAGIEVHAWLNMLSLSKNDRSPLLQKYGASILTKDCLDKAKIEDYKIDEQYFLEPGDLRVRKELVGVVGEVLAAYPGLDGIQFDYIRYPDVHPVYGHTAENIRRFKKAAGVDVVDDASEAWKGWKRAQVTQLLGSLVEKARSARPGIRVSTTGCMGFVRAREEAFQDWPSWVNSGLIDYVTIMSYPDSVPEFARQLSDARKRVPDFSRVHVGIGVYKLLKDPETFARQFSLCQESGGGACVFFYYSSLAQMPALKSIVITQKE